MMKTLDKVFLLIDRLHSEEFQSDEEWETLPEEIKAAAINLSGTMMTTMLSQTGSR